MSYGLQIQPISDEIPKRISASLRVNLISAVIGLHRFICVHHFNLYNVHMYKLPTRKI